MGLSFSKHAAPYSNPNPNPNPNPDPNPDPTLPTLPTLTTDPNPNQVDPRRGRGRLRDAVDPQLDGAARRRRAADRPHLDGQPRALHRLGEADRAGARAAAAATVEKVVPCGRPCGRPGWAKGNARGARVKGWGGRGCAGAGRSAIAAAGCRIRGACGSGYGRTRAVLVRPFH